MIMFWGKPFRHKPIIPKIGFIVNNYVDK